MTPAEASFEIYLQHPHTAAGKTALTCAFSEWAAAGAVEQIQRAVEQVDPDADVWPSFICLLGSAFFRQDRGKEYLALLYWLRHRLTHPDSKAALLDWLGWLYLQRGDMAKAQTFFQEVVELPADQVYLERARAGLREVAELDIGHMAPTFRATTLQGSEFALSDWKGKVVLLAFWSTTCGPCLRELPHLKHTQEQYEAKGFCLLGIALVKNPETLRSFVAGKGMTWPQVCGEKARDIAKLYNIRALPSSYLLDREGRIVAKGLRGNELEGAVKSLLRDPGTGTGGPAA